LQKLLSKLFGFKKSILIVHSLNQIDQISRELIPFDRKIHFYNLKSNFERHSESSIKPTSFDTLLLLFEFNINNDDDHNSNDFVDFATKFLKLCNTMPKNMILVCFQSGLIKYPKSDFPNFLKQTKGYEVLKNSLGDISHILFDDLSQSYEELAKFIKNKM
jgi:hypothetical protein